MPKIMLGPDSTLTQRTVIMKVEYQVSIFVQVLNLLLSVQKMKALFQISQYKNMSYKFQGEINQVCVSKSTENSLTHGKTRLNRCQAENTMFVVEIGTYLNSCNLKRSSQSNIFIIAKGSYCPFMKQIQSGNMFNLPQMLLCCCCFPIN